MEFLKHFFSGFFRKRLPLKAAALSYTSVLTLLPFVAIVVTISNLALARVDPAQIDRVLDVVLIQFVPQLELLEEPLRYSDEAEMLTKQELKEGIKAIIRELGSGRFGMLGAGTFVFLAGSLLLTIEHSLNDIWDVPYGRSILTRIALYAALMVVGSVLLLLTVIVTSQWHSYQVVKEFRDVPLLRNTGQFTLPFLLSWLVLTFTYMVLPKTKVSFLGGLTGGILAGTLLQFNTMLSFVYLYNVATATRLYGKLGILPIFLGGLYISWLIFLAGAQFTRSIDDFLHYRL